MLKVWVAGKWATTIKICRFQFDESRRVRELYTKISFRYICIYDMKNDINEDSQESPQ